MEASSNLIVSLYSLHSNFLILFCGMYLGEVSQIIFLSQNVKKTHKYIQFMSQLVRKYCIFIIYAYMWPVRGGEKGKEGKGRSMEKQRVSQRAKREEKERKEPSVTSPGPPDRQYRNACTHTPLAYARGQTPPSHQLTHWT